MKIAKATKDIRDVNVFRSEKDAERARRSALIAEAKWPKARTISIVGLIAFWACYVIGSIADFVPITFVGLFAGACTYLFCEFYYGKLQWLKVFNLIFSGASNLFIFLWIFEIMIFVFAILIMAGLAVFFGLGIILLNLDRYFYQLTVEATDGYGFDDRQARMAARKIESENRADAEKWRKTAEGATSRAKSAARSGVEAVNRKRSGDSVKSTRSVSKAEEPVYYDADDVYEGENEGKGVSQDARKIWYCPKCGAENEGRFCSSCGTRRP